MGIDRVGEWNYSKDEEAGLRKVKEVGLGEKDSLSRIHVNSRIHQFLLDVGDQHLGFDRWPLQDSGKES